MPIEPVQPRIEIVLGNGGSSVVEGQGDMYVFKVLYPSSLVADVYTGVIKKKRVSVLLKYKPEEQEQGCLFYLKLHRVPVKYCRSL